jgi:hypothetical protein
MPSIPLHVTKVDIEPPLPTNDCGECTACCDIAGVAELGKPAYARCPHMACNCTIYEKRPATCAGFRCIWHMGFFGDRPDWRPDKLGLMFEFNNEGTGTRINVFEVTPGALALNKDRLKHIIDRLKSHRDMKGTVYAKIFLGLIPFGADVPTFFRNISYAYAPYRLPADAPFSIDPLRGEATFTGLCRGLLMPNKAPAVNPHKPTYSILTIERLDDEKPR